MARWLVAGGIATLTMIGVWTVVNVVADWAGRVRYWLRDRVTPLLDPEGTGVLCAGCAGFEHCDGREGACDCTCGWSEGWAEQPLPPERSREELGFTGEPDIHCNYCTDGCIRCDPRKQDEYRWSPALERRAPKWEAEARGHYLSMGFEYPSGLMARVRELTP